MGGETHWLAGNQHGAGRLAVPRSALPDGAQQAAHVVLHAEGDRPADGEQLPFAVTAWRIGVVPEAKVYGSIP